MTQEVDALSTLTGDVSGPADAPSSSPRPRLSYLVKRVEQGSRTLLVDGLRELGLTISEYTALSVLQVRDGMSSAELARRSFVSAQAMNQVVTALEARELLVRRPDPTHRKVLRASLTAEGARVLDRCEVVIDAAEAVMTYGMSRAQVRGLTAALTRCSKAIDQAHRAGTQH